MSKAAFNRAVRNSEVAAKEKIAQQPDYEWLQIKHAKKMRLRSLGTFARALDSLYTNLTGSNPWN